MPVQVREIPFSNTKREEVILGTKVEVFAYEPVVWVSLTRPEVLELPPDALKFPAIVDTGHTPSFSIKEENMRQWTGLGAKDLPPFGSPGKVVDASGRASFPQRRQANIWLHPFPEGAGISPLNLEVAGGIICRERNPNENAKEGEAESPGPHLPLLGARAFFPKGLAVFVEYKKLRLTIGDEERLPY